jgi:hypothetical protein
MRTTFTMVAILSTLFLRAACAHGEEQRAEAGEVLAPPMVLKSCAGDKDCDDGDAKTHDFCQRFMNDQEQADSRCVHEPAHRECRTNADCDDANTETRDTCLHTVAGQGEPEAHCAHEASSDTCRADADCEDGDPSTRDYCQYLLEAGERTSRCLHDLVLSGCRSDADCNDSDSCTRDRCVRSVTEQGETVSSCSHVSEGSCQVQ